MNLAVELPVGSVVVNVRSLCLRRERHPAVICRVKEIRG